ncbi:MAG: barstar family protein [Candidatus Thiodiazotropha sp. (ex Semelilucina semeliformis)]|nr:barstar family protein [Candidatus Thiodiazotropha sp. (ex Semelilucina semeliformis)]
MEVAIDFNKIANWESFHTLFAEVMGFPDFYGNNNNAWIDCMSYIDDKESGMSKVTVGSGESLEMVILGTEKVAQKAPEVFMGFMEIVAAVNQRFIESSTQTRLKIIAT